MYQIKQAVTGSEPVTLTEVKSFLKVDYSTSDDLLTSLIKSAREQAEKYCNRSFVAQTIEFMTDYDGYSVKLPRPDHSEITEVKINDTVSTSYTKKGLTQFEVFIPGAVEGDEIKITYKSLGVCPEQVKTAIKKMVDKAYNPDVTDDGYSDLLNLRVY